MFEFVSSHKSSGGKRFDTIERISFDANIEGVVVVSDSSLLVLGDIHLAVRNEVTRLEWTVNWNLVIIST